MSESCDENNGEIHTQSKAEIKQSVHVCQVSLNPTMFLPWESSKRQNNIN